MKLEKDLDKATIEDIKKIVSEIQQKNYSPWTKHGYMIMIRRFYKWLYKTEHYPEIVSWIKPKISRCEKRLPSDGDLLTEKQVQEMIEVADKRLYL